MNRGVSLEVYDKDEAAARASIAAGLAECGLSDLLPSLRVSVHPHPDSPTGQWYLVGVDVPPHRVPKGVISGPKPRR